MWEGEDTQHSPLPFFPFQDNAAPESELGSLPSPGLAGKLLTWRMFSHKCSQGSLLGVVLWLRSIALRHIPRPRAPSLPASHSYFFRGVAGSQGYLEHSFLSKWHITISTGKSALCNFFFQNGTSGCPESGSASPLRGSVGQQTQISPAGGLEVSGSLIYSGMLTRVAQREKPRSRVNWK